MWNIYKLIYLNRINCFVFITLCHRIKLYIYHVVHIILFKNLFPVGLLWWISRSRNYYEKLFFFSENWIFLCSPFHPFPYLIRKINYVHPRASKTYCHCDYMILRHVYTVKTYGSEVCKNGVLTKKKKKIFRKFFILFHIVNGQNTYLTKYL